MVAGSAGQAATVILTAEDAEFWAAVDRQVLGCVNLTWTDAAYLFDQTLPQTPADAAGGDDRREATPLVILGN